MHTPLPLAGLVSCHDLRTNLASHLSWAVEGYSDVLRHTEMGWAMRSTQHARLRTLQALGECSSHPGCRRLHQVCSPHLLHARIRSIVNKSAMLTASVDARSHAVNPLLGIGP